MSKYIHILFLLFFVSLTYGQDVIDDSMERLLRREAMLEILNGTSAEEHTSEALKARVALSEIFLSERNVSQALRYLLEAKLNLSENSSNELKVDILSRLGKIYFDEKIFNDALLYFEEVSELENGENPIIENHKGSCHMALKNTEKAFEVFSEQLKKSESSGDSKSQLKYLQKIVDVYYQSKNYDKALVYNYKLEKLIYETPILEEEYIILNNLGYNFTFLKKYYKAIEQFKKSLSRIPEDQHDEIKSILINMAICHNNMGDMDQATKYFRKALSLANSSNDAYSAAQINHLMATTFYKNKDYYMAFDYLEKAIEIGKKENFSSLLAESFYTAATIKVEQNQFKEALSYFENYLTIRDSLALEKDLNQQQLVQEGIVLERVEKELELVRIDKALKKAEIEKLNLENNNLKLAKETLELNALKNSQQIELFAQQQTIQDEKLKNQDLEITKERQRLLLATKEKNEANQELELLRLNSEKEKQEIELLEKDKQIDEERQAAELLIKQSKIDQLEIANQKQFQKTSIIIGVLASGLLSLLLLGVFFMFRSNKKLNSQNKEIGLQRTKIQEEKEVADGLLHNILPIPVADELKTRGAAKPVRYEKVTVLFTDFSGFTRISSTMSPEDLIRDLEECFLAFDKIIEKYNIEKIKTIGDSYMCAGGIPVKNDSNPMDCVLAAVEMQEYLENLYQEKKSKGKEYWRMRVGIHTGPVVAGVIGNKKFSYDVWGDTVNIASRLETHGEVGKVNISRLTYDAIKQKVKCNYRGEIDVKNRGKLGMYFVDKINNGE